MGVNHGRKHEAGVNHCKRGVDHHLSLSDDGNKDQELSPEAEQVTAKARQLVSALNNNEI